MKFQYYFTDTLFSRILFTLLFLGALSIYSYGQINMSNTTVSTCLDVIYDDGGPGGNYTENNYQMTVCASSGTELYFVLQMLDLGTAFNGDSDILTIYEGTGTGGLVLFDSTSSNSPVIRCNSSLRTCFFSCSIPMFHTCRV